MDDNELGHRLLNAQKLEALGTLASGIAHNLNNWLSGMLGHIELIRMHVQGQTKVLEHIARLEQIVDNAAKMNQQLLHHARGTTNTKRTVTLNAMVEEVAATFTATRKDVSIRLSLDPQLKTVQADTSQIEQVLWNLFANAIDAMPNGGSFTITTANTRLEKTNGHCQAIPPGDYVVVKCADTGTGIAPELLERIFEPYFSTKKDKGNGLGLASCFSIIKGHQGYLDVTSQLGSGSTFFIYLPSVNAPPECLKGPAAVPQQGNGTILIIDDEEMLLETGAQLLSALGYKVLTALGGNEALTQYGGQLDAIDLVLIDMIMPGMNGAECYKQIKRIKPGMKTILCSGYSINHQIETIMEQGCDCFLLKPFTLSQVSEAIGQVLENGK